MHEVQSYTLPNTTVDDNDADIIWFPHGAVEKESAHCFAYGGYADIWKGTLDKEQVVVKVWRGISFDSESCQQFKQRLVEELRIWRRLRHPNVVAFKGITTDYGYLPALVLPYYHNGTVMEYLRKNPSTRVIPLVLDIAAALSYLHNLPTPVVHGDLKGSNILVNDEGKACVCDFGLANIVGESNFTTANIAGSCRWMPPEVMHPPQDSATPVSTESDVYSFSMTVLEMYTGRKPFSHRRSDTAVIFDVIGGGRPRRPICGDCPQLTDPIWTVLECCWAQAHGDRPTMDAVGRWLEVIPQS